MPRGSSAATGWRGVGRAPARGRPLAARTTQNSARASTGRYGADVRELGVIAIAGALGSVARYGATAWAQRRFGDGFPHGTLLVNVVGSFALGAVLGWALTGNVHKLTKAGVGTGFLGAFTTFSTFSCETVLLMKEGRLGAAAANVALNVVLGAVAALLGFWVASRGAD